MDQYNEFGEVSVDGPEDAHVDERAFPTQSVQALQSPRRRGGYERRWKSAAGGGALETGSGDWEMLETVYAQVRQGQKLGRVLIEVVIEGSKGTVWIDDVRVVKR